MKKEEQVQAECCSHSNGGAVGALLLVLVIVASFAMGPIDLCRTVYNQMIGDTAILKTELVDHVRARIMQETPGLKAKQADLAVARDLDLALGKKIDPQEIGTAVLWAGVEKHARGWKEKWLWVRLDRSR